VTQLRKAMLEELQRRNLSPITTRIYLRSVEEFARYYQKSPDQLGRNTYGSIRATCSVIGSWVPSRFPGSFPRRGSSFSTRASAPGCWRAWPCPSTRFVYRKFFRGKKWNV